MGETSGRWGRRAWGQGMWRLFALIWLLYLIFPVVSLVESHVGTRMVVLELAIAALFIGTYAYQMAGPRPIVAAGGASWQAIAALAALATAVALMPGSNWLGMYIYVAAASGTRQPMRQAWLGIVGTLVLALAVEARVGSSAFGPGTIGTIILAVEIVAIGGMLIGTSRMVQVNEELRRGRTAAAELAVSQERLRFARDLHDLLGHHLAVIVLKSELAARIAPVDPSRAAQEAREIEAIARTALRDVREAVSGYRHPRLDTELEGLRVAVQSTGASVLVERRAPTLSPAAQGMLGWAVREAATNIVRHSRATRVRVVLGEALPGTVRLEVSDNGPARSPAPGLTAPGTGLLGLRERAAVLGGAVEAGPEPGGGFRLVVCLPATAGAQPRTDADGDRPGEARAR